MANVDTDQNEVANSSDADCLQNTSHQENACGQMVPSLVLEETNCDHTLILSFSLRDGWLVFSEFFIFNYSESTTLKNQTQSLYFNIFASGQALEA